MTGQLASMIQQRPSSTSSKDGKKTRLNNATGQILPEAFKATDILKQRAESRQVWEVLSHTWRNETNTISEQLRLLN